MQSSGGVGKFYGNFEEFFAVVGAGFNTRGLCSYLGLPYLLMLEVEGCLKVGPVGEVLASAPSPF